MKIVVIGGSSLIGGKPVERLRQHGDEAIAASPAPGVVDVANSPSFEDKAVLEPNAVYSRIGLYVP